MNELKNSSHLTQSSTNYSGKNNPISNITYIPAKPSTKIEKVFEKMILAFGNVFTNRFKGNSKYLEETKLEWDRHTQGFDEKTLLQACNESVDIYAAFGPTMGEFKNLCKSIQSRNTPASTAYSNTVSRPHKMSAKNQRIMNHVYKIIGNSKLIRPLEFENEAEELEIKKLDEHEANLKKNVSLLPSWVKRVFHYFHLTYGIHWIDTIGDSIQMKELMIKWHEALKIYDEKIIIEAMYACKNRALQYPPSKETFSKFCEEVLKKLS